MNSKMFGSLIVMCGVAIAGDVMAVEPSANSSADVADKASVVVNTDVQTANDLVNQIGTPVAPAVVVSVVEPAPAIAPLPTDNSSYYHHSEYHPDVSSSSPYKFHAGLYSGVGFPSGAEIGLLVSPWLPWLKLGAGANWNYVGEGLSGHATIDPFKSPIALTLTGEAGGFFPATVPGVKNNSPTLAYTYEDILLGLEFGSRRHFRFFLRGGVAHVDANVSNFGNAFTLPAGVSIGNPNVSLVSPAGRIGFDWLF